MLQLLRFRQTQCVSLLRCVSTRVLAGEAQKTASKATSDPDLYMDFPGGKVPFTSNLSFIGGPKSERRPIPCYRIIDSTGTEIPGALIPHPMDKDTALKLYKTMVTLQTADTIFYESQRQVLLFEMYRFK